MTMAQIVDVLGGSTIFPHPILNSNDLVEQVRAGLPASTVTVLAEKLSMHRSEVAARLNIPARTLSRRMASSQRLTHDESDRAMRMARVVALASYVLGAEDKAARWMVAPNRALGGDRPFDRLDTELGVRSAEEILYAIQYGMYS
jgi:putative toxin-antitoxin system antitoxin component (TIGR02293 family)